MRNDSMHTLVTVRSMLAVAALVVSSSAACASGGASSGASKTVPAPVTGTAPPSPTNVQPTPAARPDPIRSVPRNGHPGFDTRVYPGETALRAWEAHSPYEWVGYYLVAPCQKGTTWSGKRAALKQMGWGIAVIYIGEQDWPDAARDSTANASSTSASSANTGNNAGMSNSANTGNTAGTTAAKQCTAANLTAAKGELDAARSDSTAGAEGFASGTVIYLDIERVEGVSKNFETYIRAWVRTKLTSGKYTPGIYVHEKNANALHAIVKSEYANAGRAGEPPIWIASPVGFDVGAAPSASSFSFARIWQGVFNKAETWGGVTLTIDANVATTADPSVGG